MSFLFGHPVLLALYLWLIMPVLGMVAGVICGMILRITRNNKYLSIMIKAMECGSVIGFVAATASQFIKYRSDAFATGVLLSEDSLIQSAVGFLFFVIFAELSVIHVTRQQRV